MTITSGRNNSISRFDDAHYASEAHAPRRHLQSYAEFEPEHNYFLMPPLDSRLVI